METKTGKIIKALSGFYYVECETLVFECKARGIFRKNNQSPVVGDNVTFSKTAEGMGMVEAILPRKNLIDRPLISNIDKLFIISSLTVPPPNALIIDRLCVAAERLEVEPIIVFNKTDQISAEQWVSIYKNAGFKTIAASALNGEGIDEICEQLKNSISAFAGNTGAGKSSLINAIFGTDLLKVGDVSQKLGRGRHTTRHIELIRHKFNGYVADTPGFSAFDEYAYNGILKTNLQYYFKDFQDYINNCKFTSCSHTGEKGCAVCEAVNTKKIEKSRYNSYLSMYNDLKNKNFWEKQ